MKKGLTCAQGGGYIAKTEQINDGLSQRAQVVAENGGDLDLQGEDDEGWDGGQMEMDGEGIS